MNGENTPQRLERPSCAALDAILGLVEKVRGDGIPVWLVIAGSRDVDVDDVVRVAVAQSRDIGVGEHVVGRGDEVGEVAGPRAVGIGAEAQGAEGRKGCHDHSA